MQSIAHSFFAEAGTSATPIWFVTKATWPDIRAGLPASAQAFADAGGFEPKSGRYLAVPAADGSIAAPRADNRARGEETSTPALAPAGAAAKAPAMNTAAATPWARTSRAERLPRPPRATPVPAVALMSASPRAGIMPVP